MDCEPSALEEGISIPTPIATPTSIAVFMPIQPNELPYYTGLVGLGCLFSGIVACIYTIFIFLNKPSIVPLEFHYQPAQLADSVVIAATSTVSLAVALEINMPRPYWVLVGCYVVISGMSFLSMWHKQVQRIVGTTTGMGVAWLIFMLQPDAWGVAALLSWPRPRGWPETPWLLASVSSGSAAERLSSRPFGGAAGGASDSWSRTRRCGRRWSRWWSR